MKHLVFRIGAVEKVDTVEIFNFFCPIRSLSSDTHNCIISISENYYFLDIFSFTLSLVSSSLSDLFFFNFDAALESSDVDLR